MTRRVWQLPWKGESVPHAVLDLLRGCNIACRACYNAQPARAKPLDEVRREFEWLAAHRRLDSVSLLGGEPTLHPQLCDIVRMIKAAGVSVELFTNGLLLERQLLSDLHAAGVDMVFLHIDANQNRPDFGSNPTAARLREVRTQRAMAVAAAGMEVGLTLTAYDDALEEVDEAVRFVLASPTVDYLLVTLFRDVPALGPIVGDLDHGMQATCAAVSAAARRDRLTADAIRARLYREFDLQPFACLGSNRSADDMRWLSYLVGAVLRDDGASFAAGLKISVAEKIYLALHRRLRGCYPFYLPQNRRRGQMQLLVNALAGGAARSNFDLLRRSWRKGHDLRMKRLLFQRPAEVAEDGTIVHCRDCPDATVRQGRLVPVCICDQVIDGARRLWSAPPTPTGPRR